ncbi:cell-cycle-link protein [Faba bean yellow leaf virus]|uniref:Cell-cycle-link protein n=1 Tax=Faba bean yellow leaf virus TaxID=1137801 RepID=K4Q5S1_9VIRU|nr:cell-cycle-link protein [Faba bean yellow leaf virus]CCF74116.1 cell-cycle-link protein [Faba bean yellow leaf virus]
MDLNYFSRLPVELREKIVREHMKEERKKEFLENSIEDSCRRYEALLNEDPSSVNLRKLSNYLDLLADYVGNQFNRRCLIRWKKDVPCRVKYGVIEEEHMKLSAYLHLVDFDYGELFPSLLPLEEDDDVSYVDGTIVRCSLLDFVHSQLDINVVYITVSKNRICTPLRKNCNLYL